MNFHIAVLKYFAKCNNSYIVAHYVTGGWRTGIKQILQRQGLYLASVLLAG